MAHQLVAGIQIPSEWLIIPVVPGSGCGSCPKQIAKAEMWAGKRVAGIADVLAAPDPSGRLRLAQFVSERLTAAVIGTATISRDGRVDTARLPRQLNVSISLAAISGLRCTVAGSAVRCIRWPSQRGLLATETVTATLDASTPASHGSARVHIPLRTTRRARTRLHDQATGAHVWSATPITGASSRATGLWRS